MKFIVFLGWKEQKKKSFSFSFFDEASFFIAHFISCSRDIEAVCCEQCKDKVKTIVSSSQVVVVWLCFGFSSFFFQNKLGFASAVGGLEGI
jgi:hypothetical protein